MRILGLTRIVEGLRGLSLSLSWFSRRKGEGANGLPASETPGGPTPSSGAGAVTGFYSKTRGVSGAEIAKTRGMVVGASSSCLNGACYKISRDEKSLGKMAPCHRPETKKCLMGVG